MATLYEDLVSRKSGATMFIGNSVWIRKGYNVLPRFIEESERYFRASTQALDFDVPSAADVINRSVSEQTRGQIPAILDGTISPQTVLFFVNTIYFDGKWAHPFEKRLTADGDFHLENGKTKKVKLMSVKGEEFDYLKTPLFEAVGLPYRDSKVEMIVLLPAKNNRPRDIVKALSKENWNKWLSQMHSRHGHVQLPRFVLDYKTELNSMLQTIGMRTAFTQKADFKKLSLDGKLYIDRVLHRAQIRIDEEGTVAAAATSMELRDKGESDEAFSLVVDRPFVLCICDDSTNLILFSGVIGNPTSS